MSTHVLRYEEEEEESSSELLILGVLLALLLAQMVSHSLEVYQIKFIHMSGIHILAGIWLGLLMVLFGPKTESVVHYDFPQHIFFEALLPPIIFAAGYDLNRSYFLKNIRLVLCMGLIGTIINFFIIGTLFIWAQNNNLIKPANGSGLLTHVECLQFAAILSATDAICVMTLIDSEAVPHVFNVLASEGVINDAVAIILYTSVSTLERTNGIYALTPKQIGEILLKVIEMSVLSGLYGVISGAVVSFYFKRLRTPGEAAMEGLVLFLFSYLSYQVAELLNASGIISVFFNGFMISKYTFWSLSEECRETLHVLVHFISESCEKLIFVLLGMYTFRYSSAEYWSITLIAFTLIAIIIGRVVLVVVTTNVTNLLTPKKARMGWSEQLIFIWGGLVRGAIAFGLSVAHTSEHQGVITTATLCVVIISTMFVGSLSSMVLSSLPIRNPNIKRSTFFETTNTIGKWFRKKDRRILQKFIGGESAPRLIEQLDSQKRSVSTNIASLSGRRLRRTFKSYKGSSNPTDSPITCLKKSIWDENFQIPPVHKREGSSNDCGFGENNKTMSSRTRDARLRPIVLDIPRGLSEDERVHQDEDLKVPKQILDDRKSRKQTVQNSPERLPQTLCLPSNASRKSSFDLSTDQLNCTQKEQT